MTGLKGKMSEKENVFKVSKPRDDIKIKVDQWSMPAFMGLSSWAAFTPAADGKVMMMGDTMVFQDEVNPAMSAAFEAGLEVTALHNHFFFDQPKVYFMHIGGTGDEAKLAAGVKKVYDRIAEIRAKKPTPDAAFPGSIPASNSISPEPLQKILGMEGESKDGIFKVVAGRPAVMHGISVGKEMGVNTWAAFAGSDKNAVVDGDFVVREDELQPALRTLREGDINIVVIHQHTTHEEPRYIFSITGAKATRRIWLKPSKRRWISRPIRLQNRRTASTEPKLPESSMKSIYLVTVLSVVTAEAMAQTVPFDDHPVGQPPSGWTCGTTGKGTPRWAIEADSTAPSKPNVLKQSGEAAFPWCVKDDTRLENGVVEVKFKALSGKEDQADGLVWRFKDGGNYYVARANALENNVSLYYTVNGKRKTIKYVDAPVALNEWHTFRVDFYGETIRVSLNGKTYIDLKNDEIAGAGKAGVWTKADSVTLFDDFAYKGEAGK